MRQGLPLPKPPKRRRLPFRVMASWPPSLTAFLLAALFLSPACQKAEADDAALGLEHALRDTRTSLAALGVSPSPGVATAYHVALPLPPTDSTPRRAGSSPPATAALLQGIGPAEVISALGEPSLRRREGGAEIWLYQAADCRLDLIFYPEAGRLLVAHAAARAFGTKRMTEAACLATIAVAPHPLPWTMLGAASGR